MRLNFLFISLLLVSLPAISANFVSPEKPQNGLKPQFDYDVALKTSQAAIGRQLVNHTFTNAKGQKVTLADFRGKPLVISMVYTSCYKICPLTTRYLSKVIETARDAVGQDAFEVAVIGFDTKVDTPEAMQYFANKQGISNKHWNLLSVSDEELDGLVKDLGFLYFPTSDGFDHLIQVTVIDADGKVYRQVYGQAFEPPQLVDALLELVLGRPQPQQSFVTSLSNKIKLFCTTYDPLTGVYYFDYSFFIEMFIGITVIVAISLFMRNELKKGKAT